MNACKRKKSVKFIRRHFIDQNVCENFGPDSTKKDSVSYEITHGLLPDEGSYVGLLLLNICAFDYIT